MPSASSAIFFLSCAAGSGVGVLAYSPVGPESRFAEQQSVRRVPLSGLDESPPASSRRRFLERALVAGAAAAASFVPHPASASLESEDFSNDFIQKLKAQSDAKRSEYDAAATTGSAGFKKLNTAKFSAQYDRPKFVGVKRKDGTYKMINPEEVEELQKAGMIVVEYDTILNSLGQEVPNYKKGPIPQFVTENESI